MRILYIWLPCEKIYPNAPVSLADYIHKAEPEIEQKIIDLSLIGRNKRMDFLLKNVDDFNPDIAAFSWRDIQIFSPKQEDKSLEKAFRFYYSWNPLDKLDAMLFGLKAMLTYKTRTDELLGYINAVHDRKVVVGGGAFSIFADRIMRKLNDNVVGVLGEGEDALLKIAKGAKNTELLDERVIFKNNSKLVFGEQKKCVEIEKFTPTDFDYVQEIFPQFKEYLNEHIGLQTKRGCPYRCIFCSYPFIEGRKIRYKKAETIAEEVSTLCSSFGVKKFWFVDSQFISSPKTIKQSSEILSSIRKSSQDIEWGGYVRIDNINKELAENMANSGINYFELSITSGSQKLVNVMKMGYKIDRVLKACELIKNSGYDNQKVIINYSLNAPKENKDTLKESINVYKKVREMFGRENVLPYIFFLGIQPHTELERYAISTGYLERNYDPLAINPRTAKKLIYNPPPLNKLLANLYIKIMGEISDNDRENFGIYFMEELEKKL